MLTLCINLLYINGGKHTVLDFSGGFRIWSYFTVVLLRETLMIDQQKTVSRSRSGKWNVVSYAKT